MSRLPIQKRSTLEGEQKKYSDAVEEMRAQYKGVDTFTIVNEDDTFAGPFGIFLQIPHVAGPFFSVTRELSRIEGFSQQAREVAILTTGTAYQAAYEVYAHRRVAAEVGLSQLEIDEICAGKKPATLSEDCALAFDVAKAVHGKPGPLDKALYDRAVALLGLKGTLALVQYCGLYAYVSVILNAHDIPVPLDGQQ